MRLVAERRARGFTLIEILIALVIVSIGLIGVLALLTTSLRAAGEIVEESFAATTARSVYESVREGARKRGFLVKEPANGFVRGFVFLHDGVRENAGSATPATPADQTPPIVPTKLDDVGKLGPLRASDFAIFLPTAPTTGSGEPIFVYPRPTGAAAENTFLGRDNYDGASVGYLGEKIRHDIRRTYKLRDHPVVATANGPEMFDAGDQYSFAVAISRSPAPNLIDDSGVALGWSNGANMNPAVFPPRLPAVRPAKDGLYVVEVMIFRNFDPNKTSRYHIPVPGGRFVGLVAIGP